MRFKSLLPSVVALLLVGCASIYDIDATDTPKYVKPTTVANIYVIAGRFAINHGDKHDYGNFDWSKTQHHEELNLSTPMGQTIARVMVESNVPTLTTQDHVYVGDDVEDLLYQHLGIDLPIDYLHYWVAGVPFPDDPVTGNLMDGFIQSGFKVEYLSWQDANHPHILKCSNKDLVIKLLITWE